MQNSNYLGAREKKSQIYTPWIVVEGGQQSCKGYLTCSNGLKRAKPLMCSFIATQADFALSRLNSAHVQYATEYLLAQNKS